jgi:hypothetical protein
MSTGRQLLEELRRDEELRRALAEELLPEALRHRELRRAMLIAISREMATKDDVEGLKEDIENLRREMATKEDIEGLRKATKEDVEALKEDIEALRREMEGLRKEMATKEDRDALRKEIEGLRKEMATKEDVEKLRAYVDARLEDLNRRIGDLYGVVKASLIAIVVTLASTILTPLILRLLLGGL